jgi:DNA repair protein RadD
VSLILHPYQERDADTIRAAYREGARAPLYVAPCGSGKTVIFSYICRGAMRLGKKVEILVHRTELVDQVSATLNEFEVPHGIISAGYTYRPHLPVYVASVFTLVRRAGLFTPDLTIVDEAHHCVETTTWGKVVARGALSRLLGVTATPCRMSGEGLGGIFDRLILGPTPGYLIELGYLTPLRCFAPPTINTDKLRSRMGDFLKGDLVELVDRQTVTGSAVDHYRRLADGKQAVAFCVSIEHAQHVAKQFREAGYPAESVDGKLDRQLRRQIIGGFARGETKVIASCDLISEGFDCPRIEVGISLRPTQSVGLWLQQCGRILRTYPGKKEALLLDHAGNTLRHGLPTDERAWSLEGLQRHADGRKPVNSIRICPNCFSAQSSRLPDCHACGYVFPIDPRTVAQREGDLEELTAEQIAARRQKVEAKYGKDVAYLTKIGEMRGYKDPLGWAKHVAEARTLKKKRA